MLCTLTRQAAHFLAGIVLHFAAFDSSCPLAGTGSAPGLAEAQHRQPCTYTVFPSTHLAAQPAQHGLQVGASSWRLLLLLLGRLLGLATHRASLLCLLPRRTQQGRPPIRHRLALLRWRRIAAHGGQLRIARLGLHLGDGRQHQRCRQRGRTHHQAERQGAHADRQRGVLQQQRGGDGGGWRGVPMQKQGMLAQLPRQARRLAVAAVPPGSESGGAGAPALALIAFMRRYWVNWGAPGPGSAGGGCKGAGGGPPFSAARHRLTCSSLAAALTLMDRWRRAGRAGSTGRPAAACKLTAAAACIALPALNTESSEG